MELQNDFNFSTEPVYTKFTLGSTSCILREASEDAHNAYKNHAARNMRVNENNGQKTLQSGNISEADTLLVSRCLFKLEGDKEIPFKESEVANLPRRITSRLYNWIRANSGMDEEVETIEFLRKRIESDTAKLEALTSNGTPGKGEQSSTLITSG